MRPRQPTDPDERELVIAGPVADGDVAALCARLRELARDDPVRIVVCDVGTLAPEARSVDALARLALTARRLGCPLRLRNVSPQLRGLVGFCGLDGVLADGPGRAARQPRGAAAGRRAGTSAPRRGTS